MFSTKNAKGFTLIELLVVITIIGVLATGGVVTYTSQIQKARDTTRIKDMEALKSGVEQVYQDLSEYPNATVSGTNNFLTEAGRYIPKLPRDPKSGQSCNKGAATVPTACDYLYAVADDANGIRNGEFKLSTAFENSGNVTSKAATDGGKADEVNRLEAGLNLANAKPTRCDRSSAITGTPGATRVAATADCVTPPTAAVLIAGN
jgi:prepilin-type N-terminal cleavage/methylation domain-containing protein